MSKEGTCELCNRQEMELTLHHLIPKSLHSRKWYRNRYKKEELKVGIYVCHDCHVNVHKSAPEKDLGKLYNTKEKLLAFEPVKKFSQWIGKRPSTFSSYNSHRKNMAV